MVAEVFQVNFWYILSRWVSVWHIEPFYFQGGVWEAGGVLWGSGAGVRLQSICRTNDSCQSSHYLYYAEDRELNSLIHTLLYQRLCLGSYQKKRSFY